MVLHGSDCGRLVQVQPRGGGEGAEGGRDVRLHDGEHRSGLRGGETVRADPGGGAPRQQGIWHRSASK